MIITTGTLTIYIWTARTDKKYMELNGATSFDACALTLGYIKEKTQLAMLNIFESGGGE